MNNILNKTLLDNIDNISNSISFVCDPHEVRAQIPSHDKALNILTQNICSVSANLSGLEVLMSSLDIELDIIILTECWLSKNPYLPSLQGYTSHSSTSPVNQNDGVIVYYKTSLAGISISEPTIIDDASCILIQLDKETVILGIYRPCTFRNHHRFTQSLNLLLQNLRHFKNIIVLGDINIDITPSRLDEDNDDYLDILALHGLLPTHTYPTRKTACLDHIFLKSSLPAHSAVVNSTVTDHKAVLLSLNTNKNLLSTSPVTRIDHTGLTVDINSIDFSPILSVSDPEIATNLLVFTLRSLVSKHSISKTAPRRRRILKPWITQGLLRCIRNRNNLYKKLMKNQTNENLRKTYYRYRLFCNKTLKSLKKKYESELIKNAGNNSKSLWNAIKNVTNSSKPTTPANPLLTCMSTINGSLDHVNSHFVNMGKSLAENLNKNNSSNLILPQPSSSPNQNLPQNRSFSNATKINPTPKIKPSTHKSLVLLHATDEEIENIINTSRENCAVGWDNISMSVIKRNKRSLIPIITHICNLSLSTGIFPTSLKKALVHPIYKAGDRSDPNNYRPISILPALSKILERVINSRLTSFLETFSILADNQHGFRHGRSTDGAVLELTDFVARNLDAGNKCLSIFLDLAKAFDTVSTKILIQKLEAIGVRGTQLKLFESFLTGRTQQVVINGQSSSELPTHYGVPQGSILGPTLFLIYVNDLFSLNIPQCKIISYADDTALLFTAKTWYETYQLAQSGLNTVSAWLRRNLLTLNVKKSHIINFSIYNLQTNKAYLNNLSIVAHTHSTSDNISCDCSSLASADSIKYLGVVIDKNLSFKPHINITAGRIRKLIYIFKRLRHVADPKIVKMVYLALGQSLLTYCITSWGGISKTTLLKLERAQRALLKVCTFKPFLFPTHDLYQFCDVLTVRQLFILNTIIHQHSSTIYNPTLSRRNRLVVLSSPLNTEFSHRFFCFIGPFLYNKLHGMLNIFSLPKYSCKSIVSKYLKTLNYHDTESLLIPLQ